MKISLKIASAVALTTLVFSGGANAASVTSTASATIATPIAISQTSAMSFGTVTASAAAGTAVLSTAGGLTATGGAGSLGGTISAAAFNVTGSSGATFSISLPATATLSSGASSMSVSGFNHDAGVTPTLASGTANFSVGATLNINANQVAGAYSGTYAVTTNYN